MKSYLFAYSLLFIIYSNIAADIINVPGDQLTIQAGIDSAMTGDTVLVAEDTYYENILFNGKAITVASHFLIDGDTSHISNTIINGSQPFHPDTASVVYFVNGEDTTSALIGFAITGGTGTLIPEDGIRVGGGIVVIAGGKILNNIITANSLQAQNVEALGGGIVAGVSPSNLTLIIEGNIISSNSIEAPNGAGGGIFVFAEGNCLIRENTIIDNSIENDGQALGGGLYFTAWSLLSTSLTIENNLIAGNIVNSYMSGNAEGGGVCFDYAIANFRNNVIVNNTALYGGGLSLFNYGDGFGTNINPRKFTTLSLTTIFSKSFGDSPFEIHDELEQFAFINNTVAHNEAIYEGGGFYSTGLMVRIMNSIVWGNVAPSNSQISGSMIVDYSDVEGGYAGMGNMNLDPVFADSMQYYLTPNVSPCIDAGNPDSLFNDVEDPNNPGYALWPALGELRNDMGAYGGDPNVEPGELFSHGPQFQAFLNRILSALIWQRPAIADSFIAAVPSFPFIEENTIAYFLYTGTANTITVPGDANGWDPEAFPMNRIEGTSFWYYGKVFEPDARLDYKFVLNGNSWITDPRNPHQVWGGFGPNSELAMPEYMQPPEILNYPNIPHGSLYDTTFYSTNLNNSRTIRVYTPPSYNPASSETYPLMLFHDGLEYISLGFANRILDYLISENRIQPIIGVFVPPVNRDDEYAWNLTGEFSAFIINELMPYIDSRYKTKLDPAYRAMVGPSYGGLITTQICYEHPESFGLCAPFSPSYWAKNRAVFNSVVNGPVEDIKIYLDWGSYEIGIALDAKSFRDILISKGYDEVLWNEWHEGHSWGSWRAHLDIALEFFFPKPVDVSDENIIPEKFALLQNYPNPFNPNTVISYQLAAGSQVILKVYDILGKEVATLVNEEKSPGIYEIDFDASSLSSGIYFYRFETSDFIETKKMILLK